MSEQQQPKEHCEHECVCDNFHPEYDPDYQEICNNSDCPHDTRSLPHPAPQAQTPILERFATERGEKVFLIYEGEVKAIKAFCARHGLTWGDNHIRNRNDLQEHDAAIARDAREDEREMDELYAWLSEKVEPHEAAMRVLTIGEKIKSLREGAK